MQPGPRVEHDVRERRSLEIALELAHILLTPSERAINWRSQGIAGDATQLGVDEGEVTLRGRQQRAKRAALAFIGIFRKSFLKTSNILSQNRLHAAPPLKPLGSVAVREAVYRQKRCINLRAYFNAAAHSLLASLTLG